MATAPMKDSKAGTKIEIRSGFGCSADGEEGAIGMTGEC